MDYWADILAFYRGNSVYLTEEEVNEFETFDNDQLKVLQQVTGYQGLDVRAVQRSFYSKHANYKKNTVAKEGEIPLKDGKIFKYSSHDSAATDAKTLAFIFASSGSNWERIKSKSTEPFQLYMDVLKTKYKIDTSKRKSGDMLKANIITLPRFAACFPSLVCSSYHNGYGKPLCGLDDILIPDADKPHFKDSLLCRYLSAVVPKTWATNNKNIHSVLFLVSVLTDNVIHRDPKKRTKFSDLLTYYKASFNSLAVPETSRVFWFKQRGLGNASGNGFHELFSNNDYIKSVEDKLSTIRGTDEPDSPTILRTLKALN